MRSRFASQAARIVAVVASMVVVTLGLPGIAAAAPGPLTITPLGWNVVGLRSNDVTDGPNRFMVGARVCNTGTNPVSDVTATWVWDQANAYVSLAGISTRAISSLAAAGSPGDCRDAWFLVEVARNVLAFDTSRDFHVSASATGQTTVSTPAGREIYVQKLIRQNRNTVSSIVGPSTVYVGSSYTYTINASTSTAYEQLATTGVFASPIFEVRSVTLTYDNPGGSANQFYVDACGFQPNPAIVATYLSCVGPANVAGGKAGGNLVITVVVDAVGTGTTNVSAVIYDLSGGSYHYNQDYGTGTNSLTITSSYPDTAPDAVADSASTNEDTTVDVDVLANDSDVNGNLNASSLSVATQPSNGTASIVGGQVRYVPNANFNGTDTLTYQVCDSTSPTPLCDTATVTITVNAVNDPPDAVNDSESTNEDTALTFDPRSNDTDPENDALTITGTSGASHGTVSFTGTSVTYTPTGNYNGPDSFTYTISDGNGGTDTATVSFTVNSVNDGPDAVNDSESTNEDTALTFDPRSNDTDPENDALTITGTSGASHGTVSFTGTSVTYTPTGDYNGPDSFTYTISDGNGGTDTATVSFTVNSVNDGPDAVNDSESTNEDTALTFDPRSNDTDPENDALTITGTSGASHGTVSFTGTSVTYTPTGDYNGPDSFTYTISDGNGGTDTATVNVTVDPVNDPPTAANDAVTTDEDVDVSVDVAALTGDVDGDPLTVTIIGNPTHGSLVDNLDGTFTYTPDPDYNGPDSFTYEACDASGACDTGVVSITVDPVNDPPTAANDAVTTDEDVDVSVDVAALTGDVDGDPLTVTIIGNPTHGSLVDNLDGTFTYTPDPDYNGPDSFTYEACDADGACDTGVVSITVDPVNDPPVADDDPYTVDQDSTTVLDVVANDSDLDGDSLTVGLLTGPSHGAVVDNGDGTFSYTPDPGYLGPDSFSYEACDPDGFCDSATVTLSVADLPEPPAPLDDFDTVSEDGSVNINVLGNDTDPENNIDPTTVTITTAAGHGTTTVNGLTGVVTYAPGTNYNGTDTFTYEVCDTGLPVQCASAAVSVAIDPVNDPPTAANDAVTTDEDVDVSVDVAALTGDVDGDPLTVTIIGNPTHGSLVDNLDGTFSYTPDPDYNGPDSFTYEACDTDGACDTGVVTITVDPVNDPPTAANDAVTTDEDVDVSVDVAALTGDVDGDPLTITIIGNPTHGSLVDNLDGTFTYTPTGDYNGPDSFTYEACDASGACDTGVVSITVDPVNDPPVAVDDSLVLDEDTSATTVDVRTNDSDAEDPDNLLTASLDTGPSHGAVVDNGDGTFTYTPDADYSGPDSFTYQVCDTAAACVTATVDITVDPVDDPPVANDDSASTSEDTDVTVSVLANDTDIDSTLTTVAGATVSVTGAPTNGTTTVNANGSVTYSPDPGFNGLDSFTYQLCDSDGECDSADVSLTVTGVNDDPVANNDSDATDEDTSVDIAVLSNDTDPEGQILSVTSATDGSNGTTTVNGDGTITYTPDAGWFGVDTFTYSISDGNGGSATATVTVTVNSVNDGPAAVDNSAVTDEDTTVTTIDVTGNDTDPDGDTLTVSGHTAAGHGSVTDNGDGTFDYTPDADYSGPDSFTYTISDGNGGTATASVNITVNPVNDPPVADDDAATTDETQPVDVDVLANDDDIDSPLTALGGATVTVTSGPSNGSVTVNGDLTITYTPDPGFAGVDSFTYEVCDADGDCDSATVDVTVADDLAPTALDDGATTDEDVAVVVDVLANDTDPESSPLTVVSFTNPGHGTVVDNGDGTFTYTPDPDWYGTDTFTYTIEDPLGNSATATVTVTVDSVNDTPNARNDSASTLEDTPVDVVVLTNDSDPEGDTLSVISASNGTHGATTVNGNGTVTYTPDAGWSGTDTFTYTISDGNGGTDTATVTVTVDLVNVSPTAVDDAVTTAEDHPVTVPVKSNDTDPDGDPLTVQSVTQPAHGRVTRSHGKVVYTPDQDWNGTDTFTYTVCDPAGSCDVATVTVTVAPRDDAPVAQDDAIDAEAGTPVTIPVIDNDDDVDGEPLTVSVVDQPASGSVVVKPDGTVVFTADAGADGVDTFTYEICDPDGDCSRATVTVTVAGASNPAPPTDPNPTTKPQGGPLPHTGAEVTRLALWGASLLAMGAALLLGSVPLRLRRGA